MTWEVKPASAILKAEKTWGKSLPEGVEGPSAVRALVQGGQHSPAGTAGALLQQSETPPPPGKAGSKRTPAAILTGVADRLAVQSLPKEGKRHSGTLAPLTVTVASWKACSAEPYPCEGGKKRDLLPFQHIRFVW